MRLILIVSLLLPSTLLASPADEPTPIEETSSPDADADTTTPAPGAQEAPADATDMPDHESEPAGGTVPIDVIPEARVAIVLPKTTLFAGQLQGTLAIEANFTKDLRFRPVSIAPDIYYGINNQLTVGLVHSALALDGFYSAGKGLCLTGKDDGCSARKDDGDRVNGVYTAFALDGKYEVLSSTRMSLAAHVQLQVGRQNSAFLDPFLFDARLGATGLLRAGPMRLSFSPYVRIAATKRDDLPRDILGLPITMGFQANRFLMPFVKTGVLLPFEQPGDTYQVPIGVGVTADIIPNLRATAAFQFTPLTGFKGDGPFDTRFVNIHVTYTY